MARYAFLALLLLPGLAAAAQVETVSSGFTRGSLDYIFMYDPMDAGTTVSGILPNDFVTIEYQEGDRTYEYRLFFTRQFGDEWQFDEWTGERRLSIELGGTYEIDLNEDGEVDLVMTYEEQQLKKGVFTFLPAKPECQIDIDCTAQPRGECVEGSCVYPEPECAEDADCAPLESCAAGLCLLNEGACRDAGDCDVNEACTENACVPIPDCTTDEECAEGEACEAGLCIIALDPSPPTWMPEQPPGPPIPPAPETNGGGTIFWSLVIILALILIGAFFAFRTPRTGHGRETKQVKRHHDSEQNKESKSLAEPTEEPPKPISKPEREAVPEPPSKKHDIISRAPRKR